MLFYSSHFSDPPFLVAYKFLKSIALSFTRHYQLMVDSYIILVLFFPIKK